MKEINYKFKLGEKVLVSRTEWSYGVIVGRRKSKNRLVYTVAYKKYQAKQGYGKKYYNFEYEEGSLRKYAPKWKFRLAQFLKQIFIKK